MRKIIKDETGAAMIVEAVIIYPIVILCLFFLIYVGLLMIQSAMLSSCAEKMAMVAAREVAYPGYLKSTGGAFTSNSVDLDDGGEVNVTFIISETEIKPYRYWSPDPLSNESKETIKDIICNPVYGIVKTQSILGTRKTEATVICTNYLITQYVKVTIKQEVLDIGVLKYFGLSNPTVNVEAVAAVGDSDEFVRNTDLMYDAVKWLAEKLGIDFKKIKGKIESALDKIGISW